MPNEASQSGRSAWWRIALIGRNPRRTLVRAAVLGAAVFVIGKFVLLHVRVDGISMLPTYADHSTHFVNRFAYLCQEPRRGDVVSVRISGAEYLPREFFHDLLRLRLRVNRLAPPSVMYLKRIVGLPGETIAFSDGQLFVDHKPVAEPYVKFPCRWTHEPIRLGSDEYFVVGDNRSMPWTAHTMPPAPRNRIVGKLLL